jgi:hypothetical protein
MQNKTTAIIHLQNLNRLWKERWKEIRKELHRQKGKCFPLAILRGLSSSSSWLL